MTAPIPTGPGPVVPPAVPAPVPTPPPAPAPPAPAPAGTRVPQDEPLGEGGLRALQSERDARKAAEKLAAEREAELDAIRQRDMTELQRAQSDATSWQTKYQELEARERRNSIALEKGIPNEYIVFLNGSTEDELRAQAEGLKTLIDGKAAATAPPAFVPNPGQAPGNGTPPPAQTATVDAGRSLYKQRNNKSN